MKMVFNSYKELQGFLVENKMHFWDQPQNERTIWRKVKGLESVKIGKSLEITPKNQTKMRVFMTAFNMVK